MKRVKYFLIGVIGLLMITSCNKWLNVSPKTEMPLADLFKKESGINDALIGAYIQMKQNDGYGAELTMGTTEYLVSFWDAGRNTAEQNFTYHNYAYDQCEAKIKKIYGHLYKIISSCNSILQNIEEAKDNGVFKTKGLYEVVKAEATAMRAYCHLDVLRLFGPVPELKNGNSILPYVTTLGVELTQHTNYDKYCELLLADLKTAADLLKEYDPIVYGNEMTDSPDAESSYYNKRYLRLNYFAVKALQARANMYMGNYSDAVSAAKEVIEATDEDGDKLFNLGTLNNLTNESDYTLKSEHIFALAQHKLPDTYSVYFPAIFKKGSSHTTATNALFGGEVATDIRTNLWKTLQNSGGQNCGTIIKYEAEKETDSESTKASDFRIPMLRISEMYLIISEVASLAEAQPYWESYKRSRNTATTTLNEATRRNEIMKEYRKEFYAEGQMFYFHKRINSPKGDILWKPTTSASVLNYVLPLPNTELIN